MQSEDRECAQLLLEAGANQATPSADHDTQENIYSVGHENTFEQWAAVDDLVSAHNTNAEWLMWFNPGKTLSVMYCVEMPPEQAEPPSVEGVHYSLRRSIAHCTHGALCRNSGRAARESRLAYLQMCVRTPVS